jgi:hypothetical protein
VLVGKERDDVELRKFQKPRQFRVSQACGAVTLVTLPRVTDAATMRKISFIGGIRR